MSAFMNILSMLLSFLICFWYSLLGYPAAYDQPVRAIVGPVSESLRVMQGAGTDGYYVYVVIKDKSVEPDAVSSIVKYDPASWSIVATYNNLQIEHGNDITYNPLTDELIIPDAKPDSTLLTVLDRNTMQIKRVITLTEKIYSIAYDASQDCYYAGVIGNKAFVQLDKDFNVMQSFPKQSSANVTQGMELYKNYLCFIEYKTNCIQVYKKDGTFYGTFPLKITENEPENIFVLGDTFYSGYYISKKGGGVFYELRFFSLPDDPVPVVPELPVEPLSEVA